MSEMQQESQEIADALVKRELGWPELLRLMREPKRAGRFDTTLAAWQKVVEWEDPIILPLAEKLFIVAKDGKAIIKTRAGAELCAWDENWKMKCRMRVRRTREELLEIFPEEHMNIDSGLVEIREFYCPESGDLLDVDCVPPAFPVETDFTPDLKTLYEDWLGRKLPVTL